MPILKPKQPIFQGRVAPAVAHTHTACLAHLTSQQILWLGQLWPEWRRQPWPGCVHRALYKAALALARLAWISTALEPWRSLGRREGTTSVPLQTSKFDTIDTMINGSKLLSHLVISTERANPSTCTARHKRLRVNATPADD